MLAGVKLTRRKPARTKGASARSHFLKLARQVFGEEGSVSWLEAPNSYRHSPSLRIRSALGVYELTLLLLGFVVVYQDRQ